MKYLGFFILFFLPLLPAEEIPTRKLESIDYRSTTQGTTIVLITLSDKSTWKWIPDEYNENLLRKWKKGNEIFIRVGNQPGFILQNTSQPHYCPTVALSYASYALFPSLTNYNEGLVELSNGSKWRLIYDFNKRTLHQWSIGDQIIPVKGLHKTFELLNIDIPHGNKSQIERYIEVIPSTFPLEEFLPVEEEPVQDKAINS